MSWHKAESTPGMKTVATSTAKLHKALSGVMSHAELEVGGLEEEAGCCIEQTPVFNFV
jgi:hypothetical protein